MTGVGLSPTVDVFPDKPGRPDIRARIVGLRDMGLSDHGICETLRRDVELTKVNGTDTDILDVVLVAEERLRALEAAQHAHDNPPLDTEAVPGPPALPGPVPVAEAGHPTTAPKAADALPPPGTQTPRPEALPSRRRTKAENNAIDDTVLDGLIRENRVKEPTDPEAGSDEGQIKPHADAFPRFQGRGKSNKSKVARGVKALRRRRDGTHRPRPVNPTSI